MTPPPQKITWCYQAWQPLYTQMLQLIPNITFVEGIQVPEEGCDTSLLVLDDLMVDATKNKEVSNLFTVGSHHRNLSVICLVQNLFYHGRENRTMNLNSQYLVLFRNPRDVLQVNCLAKQMNPGNTGWFMDKFRKATAKPYGCLVIDLKQDTPDMERLRSGRMLMGSGPAQDSQGSGDASSQPPTPKEEPQQESVPKLRPPPGISEDRNDDHWSHPPPGIPANEEEISTNQEDKHLEGGGDNAWPRPPGIPAYPLDKKVWLYEPGILAHPSKAISATFQQDPVQCEGGTGADKMNPTCKHCGIVFNSPSFLHMHLQKKCDMYEDSSDEDDDDNSWVHLIQQTFEDMHELYQSKVKAYMKDGLEQEEATEKTIQDLHPKYRKTLVEKYRKFLEQMYHLDHNTRHKDIMQDVQWYMTWRGYSFEKALNLTLRKKRHYFDELLEDQNELKDQKED